MRESERQRVREILYSTMPMAIVIGNWHRIKLKLTLMSMFRNILYLVVVTVLCNVRCIFVYDVKHLSYQPGQKLTINSFV